MTTEQKDPAAGLAKMREPFPAHQISKLPKESGAQADERKQNRSSGINCQICGGWHHRNAAHLDYVGHAAITDRLLEVDPAWSWEPLSTDDKGLPAIDKDGGLWIKLTVCGVTRLGYGDAPRKQGGDAMKERIGDAIRNAAMRFGAALDLWHKGELHRPDDAGDDKGGGQDDPQPTPPELLAAARKASGNGVAAYQHFWQTASKDDRKALAGHHEALKAAAAKAKVPA